MSRFRQILIAAVIAVLVTCVWKFFSKSQEAVAQDRASSKPERPALRFEKIRSMEDAYLGSGIIRRSKVPGGWLVTIDSNTNPNPSVGITFMPDADHRWDGTSLP